jgi:predicted dehydrogenase
MDTGAGKMIQYAVVGTGPISRQFIDAATDQSGWSLRGVLGSLRARGQGFLASQNVVAADAVAYGSLADLATCGDVDVVYVASPNSLHFSIACEVLAHGKHVIVEKPAFSTSQEWAIAHEIADRRGVLLLEAARHIYENNYAILSSAVSEMGGVTGASLAFRQYSSRFPAFLAGARPRVFSAQYSGGAMADLGVYQLYAAVDWFGVPDEVSYYARILDSGADAEGVAVLRYPDFDVSLAVSKVQASRQDNEVFGPRGEALAFNNVQAVEWLRHSGPGGGEHSATQLRPLATNPLSFEVQDFTRRLLAHPAEPRESPYTYPQLRKLGADVIATSERLRRSAGVVFPADLILG